jgi:hypothetical protein
MKVFNQKLLCLTDVALLRICTKVNPENNFKLKLKETFTIDEAVEKMGFGMFQFKLSLLTGLGL